MFIPMNEWTRYVVTPEVSHEGFASLAVPVYRASTIPFADAQAYATRRERGEEGYSYGLYGTPTTRTLEQKINQLHGGVRTLLAPSGQAAIALVMLQLLSQGDLVLIPDTVYPPVRDFADKDLARLGIVARFYDPTDVAALAPLIDDRTRLVWLESPGSTTMEVQDMSAIADLAHQRGALVGCDNTWASPLYFKPLRHGADIVVEALTKFFSGHSDVLMGSVTVKDPAIATQIRAGLGRMGVGISPDDCALVLRGMETMALRMDHGARVALRLIERLQGHRLVRGILYPALPGSPGHDLWKRDFNGASGVFSVVFTEAAAPHVGSALDALKTIAIGASWGGTRSLAAPMPVRAVRSVRDWTEPDTVLRLSVGLEDEDDLAADIDRFLDYLEQCCPA
ncbi:MULTISPECIES: PLP-dependent aspartate aminotransferase family protein [unclassified Achromobacter]|uniref:trans-sulfuration enzyme family protein n=1 Tax=unclassified Achromobacter TaxID=2626865 RepID=UPI0018E95DC3|nr:MULTISPECIES: aminotransferase class I/II-fold pyridoxal phosphate-dependent enzyme [unclassified Achromobacter]